MCGIAGSFAYHSAAPQVDRDEMRRVRDHMAARGPDATGEWFSTDGRVGLGHRRLAIIDLSERGTQPMLAGDSAAPLAITFNGEIYNYRELKRELERSGRVFRTDSDTEVLLHLYELHGTAMLAMLRGMFAFALWDARKGELLLARDAFGVKPAYYADDGRTFRFASTVKSLLGAKVDTRPEPAGHAGFFLWGSVPEPWTLFRGIRSVPAGHFLRVTACGAQAPQPFCSIRDILSSAILQPARGSREEGIEAIGVAVRDSVRAHLVSDVPVGLFLSGGVDSGMLACAMADAGAAPLALTAGFTEYRGRSEDERPLAARVAGALGIDQKVCEIGRNDFEAVRSALLRAMDQPSIDGVNSWLVSRAAASMGMKVAVSGLGGDELFGSYPSFRQVPMLRRAMLLPSRVPGLGRVVRAATAGLARRWSSAKYAGVVEYGGTMEGAYLLRRALFMPWELPAVMDPEMAREGWSALQQMPVLQESSRMPDGPAADRFRVSAFEMGWYMRNQLLRDSDWAGMDHSLEIRVPLVDVQLLRTAAPWLAAHPDITKSDVARQVASRLPEECLRHPKRGFQVPVREWLANGSAPASRGLRPWAHVVLSAGRSGAGAAGRPRRPRVLVSTLAPGTGGVNAMTSFVVDVLSAHGLEPVLAHYAPYSVLPGLSVPSFRLLQRRVGWSLGAAYGTHEANAIGAWLPELEFTHYAATRRWRHLIGDCDAHVAVSGNVLAATPFWQSQRSWMAWVATDCEGDRKDRVRRFPPLRRALDMLVNRPVIHRLERKLLQSGTILPLSAHTAQQLDALARRKVCGPVLPACVDTSLFAPAPARVVRRRVGFSGRFNDPRKNISLLLAAIAAARAAGHAVDAVIVGDTAHPDVLQLAAQLGVTSHVEFAGSFRHADLPAHVQTFDVFVVPSHQEGLCIAALEAMACGVPVVSTRCGGPEEFVIDGSTGYLTGFDAAEMAARIVQIVSDRPLRDRLGESARLLVEERYSQAVSQDIFWNTFASAFPGAALAAECA